MAAAGKGLGWLAIASKVEVNTEDASRVVRRFAGICAILAGNSGFLYAVALIIIQQSSPALSVHLRA